MTTEPDELNPLPALRVQGTVLEGFEHAGLMVRLMVAPADLGPRYEHEECDDVMVFAAPYEALSDHENDKRVLPGDEVLSALLSEPLTADGVHALAEHARRVHGARVVVPLYLDERADTCTGVAVLTDASEACPIAQGAIFDTPEDEGAPTEGDEATRSDVVIRESLLLAVEDYAAHMRGNLLLGSVNDEETGITFWSDMDEDLDAIRTTAKLEAERWADDATAARAEQREARRTWRQSH